VECTKVSDKHACAIPIHANLYQLPYAQKPAFVLYQILLYFHCVRVNSVHEGTTCANTSNYSRENIFILLNLHWVKYVLPVFCVAAGRRMEGLLHPLGRVGGGGCPGPWRVKSLKCGPMEWANPCTHALACHHNKKVQNQLQITIWTQRGRGTGGENMSPYTLSPP
jgi:hypothetical protein